MLVVNKRRKQIYNYMKTDYYYYDEKKITAEQLLAIEQKALDIAIEEKWEIFMVFHMILASMYNGVVVFQPFPIILSKN